MIMYYYLLTCALHGQLRAGNKLIMDTEYLSFYA